MPGAPSGESLLAALVWVLLVWLASALGFACVRPLFASWADQGYGLAKVVGPLLVGCVAWLLSGFGLLTRPLPTSVAALLLVAAAAAGIGWRTRRQPLPSRRVTIALDLAWLASLCLFCAIRAWSPSIVGAERPMDHALLAAVLRQASLPPTDPWLAGFPVNYHFAGHALWAPLGRLSLQPPSLVYNLVLATLPGQLLAAAWSAGHRVNARWAWSGAVALVLAGPLGPVAAAAWGAHLPSSAAATRVITGTVSEFPLFSLTWGDLHAHVLALPLLVACVAFALRLDELARAGTRVAVVAVTILAALTGTAAVLTSSWDLVPVAMGVAWMASAVWPLPRRVVVASALPAMAAATLFAWPALSAFRPPPVAVGWEWHGSRPEAFLLVQGTWLLPAGLLCVMRGSRVATAAAGLGLACLAWLVPGMAVRALLLALAAGVWARRDALGRASTALLLSALGLLIAAECVWVDDVYGWEYRRFNAVFKWHLHAIVLTTLALPGVVHALWTTGGARARATTRAVLVGLAVVSMLSALVLLAARYREREPVMTLNGLAGMARHHPGDAAAVRYLWAHGAPGDVVLEAAGKSYTYGSRISAMTGVPTLLGWVQHEHLWRRGAVWRQRIDARAGLVDTLYAGEAAGLGDRLRGAGIRYVVVGPVERRRYAGLTAARFAASAEVVVDEGGTVLLRVF